jgi:hypothetical protein
VKPRKNSKLGATNLALHEIVALAAFIVGANRQRVDMEDIAVKANEIAPGRFSWRKYKDQIDIELIYKHLWDLTKPDKGEYITGSKKDGWLLTLAGTSFAEQALGELEHLQPARTRPPRQEEAWMRRERARMLSESAFQKVRDGKEAGLSRGEVERFFRLDDYVIGQARTRKIQQIENAFHGDPDIGPVLPALTAILRKIV